MESIINSINVLFQTYGFKAAIIILITILLVNLIKKPIVKYAEKYANKYECDKSIITKYLCILPFIVAFLITFLWELIISGFNFEIINYGKLSADTVMYAGLSIATFETLKLQFEAYAAKKSIKNNKTKLQENAEEKKNIEQ